MPDELKKAVCEMAAAMASNERIMGFLEGLEYALSTMARAIPEKEAAGNDV